MTNKKPLYIFLHMPKCAGSTFTYHIYKNLGPEEYLAMYANDFCFGEKHIGDYYLREAVESLKKLSARQKGKIKVIFGHGVPYGIEKYFPNREIRYITFLREPIARTVSSYNFQRSRLSWQLTQKERTYYKRFITDNNTILSFNKWINNYYDKLPNLPVGVSMTTFLQQLNYLEKGALTNKKIQNFASKFWFIGLTEFFDRDVLFFYKQLGINNFYRNKNVSAKHIHNTTRYMKLLQQKNKADLLLYQHAKHNYNPLDSGIMHYKRILFMPITQGIEDILSNIYKTSAQLKKLVPGYSEFISSVKKVNRLLK